MFADILAYSPQVVREKCGAHFRLTLLKGCLESRFAMRRFSLARLSCSQGRLLLLPPTLPKIDQAAIVRKNRSARPEFEPEKARLHTEKHTPMLNQAQRQAFGAIVADVGDGAQSSHFVDGPGGSGETSLYNVPISEIRGKGIAAASVASSGIEDLLLSGGRTAHSEFKLPIRVARNRLASFRRGRWMQSPSTDWRRLSGMERQWRIDTSRNALVDRYAIFVLTTDHSAAFRWRSVGISGQIPPVARHGRRAHVAAASLKRSPLRRQMQTRALSRNTRMSEGEGDFAMYLVRAGGGGPVWKRS